MAQEPSSEFLLAAPGIQHRVKRRTLSTHAAQASDNVDNELTRRGGPIGLGAHLSVTAAGPATEMISVVQAAPATVVATAPTVLLCLLRRLADGSRPPTPQGSLPTCAGGDVALGLNPYPAHYRPAFACSLILYPPP